MVKRKKLPFKFDLKNSSGLLVILLIVLSFFTGYLFFKVQNLQQGEVAQDAPAQQQPPAPELNLDKIPKVTKDDHIRGSMDAKLVLVEYSDFECPFCKSFHPTMQQVIEAYGDDVAWVYRHYPLDFHANAKKEAEASECIAEQGGDDAFWKYTDIIFERTQSNGTGFALTDLKPLAEELGLDGNKFQQCLDSGKYTSKVTDELNDGTKGGIQGTPGTVIITKDGKRDLIGGALPFEQVKLQLDNLLK